MAELNARHAAVMEKIVDAEGTDGTHHYAPSLDEEPEVEDLLGWGCIGQVETGSPAYYSLQPGRAAYARYLRSKKEAES